jgi:hypothetical protein
MSDAIHQLDLLFVSEHPLWPLDQGFRIHGWNMARHCAELGARVGIASIDAAPAEAPPTMRAMLHPWPAVNANVTAQLHREWSGLRRWPRRRLARFQGRDLARFAGIRTLVSTLRPRAVVALGQHGPMLLRCLSDELTAQTQLIWYAADEMVYFQLSCLRRDPLRDWPMRLLRVGLYGALEQTFARGLDGAIGVSPTDTTLLTRFAGVRDAITIRNGVDLHQFKPATAGTPVNPHRLIFWGRLDFEPNIDAVCWFAQHVWPKLRSRYPHATWQIVGKNPHPRVQALAGVRDPGLTVLGEVPDIRPLAHGAAITILPMRCGGGIKNKLLEAAAMARTIVASPKAVQGLEYDSQQPPFAICRSARQWIDGIDTLWTDRMAAQRLAGLARHWVQTHHDWRSAAQRLLRWLHDSPKRAAAVNVDARHAA